MKKVKRVKGIDALGRPYSFYEIIDDTTEPRDDSGDKTEADTVEHDSKDVAMHRPIRSRGWANFGETL